MTTLKTASVLAFERKICPSDGLMYAGSWQNRENPDAWKAVRLKHKDVKGTISNRLKGSEETDPLKFDDKETDSLKLNAKIQNANIQSVDVAALPFDSDTLKVIFSLRVLGNISVPMSCNNPAYQTQLMNKVDEYLSNEGCMELSLRYAENLANGRFLWRNRIGANDIEVRISLIDGNGDMKNWIFQSYDYNLQKFSIKKDPQIVQLAEAICKGLTGGSSTFFKIEAFVRIGMGQEVFPSQELVRDNGNDKYKKSKFLYSIDDVAAFHSQKIGNAIRTIDTWYPNADAPIAVEPYGSVTNRGVAYRQPKEKMDFYSLLDGWVLKNKTPPTEQQHYVIACLIRGGVFGEKE